MRAVLSCERSGYKKNTLVTIEKKRKRKGIYKDIVKVQEENNFLTARVDKSEFSQDFFFLRQSREKKRSERNGDAPLRRDRRNLLPLQASQGVFLRDALSKEWCQQGNPK